MGLGHDDRVLFEEEATALYEEIVGAGGVALHDRRVQEGAPTYGAFDLLRQVGLVALSEDGRTWLAVDPSAVQSQVVAPMGQRGAELIAESARWAQAFNTLSHTWRQSPAAVGGPFTAIRGTGTIGTFLASLVADAQEELLTAQPQAGRNIKQLTEVVAREVAAIERGVKMRTLYQHAARRNPDTRKYVSAVSEAGAEVRTLDEFFNRLIVVDRRIAIIPSHEGLTVAMVIREPSLIAYLVDMFERHWERARPFTSEGLPVAREIAAEQRAMTIRMLLEGRADPAGAKRLGVSPRTYAGYVADLKTEFDAETRFQLGYAMGQRGISGTDGDPE